LSGPAPEASRPRLVWERADGSQQTFPLVTSPMTVGRAESADICVDEALVSKIHARIERRGETYVVVDLGSTNLTRVNGEVVLQHELRHGDEVRFARAKCRFLMDGGDDPLAGGV
jgi:pSer/pThr/pTyr-binding forkhead associated (FHA) protein